MQDSLAAATGLLPQPTSAVEIWGEDGVARLAKPVFALVNVGNQDSVVAVCAVGTGIHEGLEGTQHCAVRPDTEGSNAYTDGLAPQSRPLRFPAPPQGRPHHPGSLPRKGVPRRLPPPPVDPVPSLLLYCIFMAQSKPSSMPCSLYE
jgi:hypothetical protein